MTHPILMKPLLALLALGATAVATTPVLAQAGSAAAAPAPKAQKLVKVSTLSTIEANREFQANVQLLQAQRQSAIELNAALEKEKDAAQKKELTTRLDALMAKLNENNDKMRAIYGFSIDRNYTVVIEKAHIYMFVSDEEAAKVEAAEKAAEAKK